MDKVKEAATDVNGNYRLTYKGKQKDIAEVASNQELLGLLRGMRVESAAKEELETGERINTNINIRLKASVFVRASFGKKEPVYADSTPMVAQPGVSYYRDVILNLDQYASFKPSKDKDIRSTRFLGNSATRELQICKTRKTAAASTRCASIIWSILGPSKWLRRSAMISVLTVSGENNQSDKQ